MILMIDNYDSFTHTLSAYIKQLGARVHIVRSDRIRPGDVFAAHKHGKINAIVISPGPGNPDENASCIHIVRQAAPVLPILGVCLGHQIIARAYGGNVVRTARPMHGKVSTVHTSGLGIFADVPRSFSVTRYHSLVVDEDSLPGQLRVDARADDGAIMAIAHHTYPVFGVQFHPEALLTEYGSDIVASFLGLCNQYRVERKAA